MEFLPHNHLPQYNGQPFMVNGQHYEIVEGLYIPANDCLVPAIKYKHILSGKTYVTPEFNLFSLPTFPYPERNHLTLNNQ